jgi:hypothetical protein
MSVSVNTCSLVEVFAPEVKPHDAATIGFEDEICEITADLLRPSICLT